MNYILGVCQTFVEQWCHAIEKPGEIKEREKPKQSLD
jgi:hypothetical protein